MRVLVVEDEIRLAEALSEILKQEHYIVDTVHRGDDGLDYALSGIYDGIVLDVMLPGMDGFSVVKELRRQKNATPVLLLTAKSETEDKVIGLDSGADDYLTKPFETKEFLARVRALVRRQGEVCSNRIQYGDVCLDTDNLMLSKAEKSVRLSMKEFETMRILMSYDGNIVTKDYLIRKVWGADSEAEDNNVEVYISFLRKKLFYLDSDVLISTVRKLGYHLEVSV